MSNSLQPYGLQHAKLPCPSPSPGASSNSWALSQWCHPIILSSVVPFSSYIQSFLASWSLLMNLLFTSGGQSIGASVSLLLMNIQHWFPLGLTGFIFLKSKGLLRVFSSTTMWSSIFWHSAFFMIQLSHPYMTTRKIINFGLFGYTEYWRDLPFSPLVILFCQNSPLSILGGLAWHGS